MDVTTAEVVTQDEYAELLQRIEAAYDKSRVKHDHPNWWYGVTATRIVRGRPLVVGINWGVGGEAEKPTRDSYPRQTFEEALQKKGELGSLVRLRKLLERFVADVPLPDIGQTNLFYFRTRYARELHAEDRDLCADIFEDFIRMAKPTLVIALSAQVRDGLERIPGFAQERTSKDFIVNARNQTFTAVRGRFTLGGHSGRWVAVPHPVQACSADSLNQIWQFCFEDRAASTNA